MHLLINIISAMVEEISPLQKEMKNISYEKIKNIKICRGYLDNTEIILVRSGIGKVISSSIITIVINYFHPDIVISAGCAGSLVPTLKIGDIVVSEKVCYHDVDITEFGYKIGQIPNFPLYFLSERNLISLTKKLFKRININYKFGLLVSGDSFISRNKNYLTIKKIFPEAIAVEMESAAIAQICYFFSVPFIGIRSISDSVYQKISAQEFKKNLNVSAKNCSEVIKELIPVLSKNIHCFKKKY